MTNSLATLDLASIPAHIRDVLLAQDARLRADQETIREIQESKALLEVQNAELKVLNERLKHLVKEFRNALYAKRSEASQSDRSRPPLRWTLPLRVDQNRAVHSP